VVAYRDAIEAALDNGMSNALIDFTNTKIRLVAVWRSAFHGRSP
jgi:hypothetical protein